MYQHRLLFLLTLSGFFILPSLMDIWLFGGTGWLWPFFIWLIIIVISSFIAWLKLR
ncbi:MULTISPECIES: hypothetical protein [Nitrincola]|uniref:Uncharacterized protein n=1 Tax=Nitrincola nitratireducens TaxID=1229521 RepID=W9VF51_9GAMM|nr:MULTISPECIES: hypothetical protein [Nitrincola]EXJ09300.1 hypothetical protein D791_03782 [Nitrincola nitratireducens]